MDKTIDCTTAAGRVRGHYDARFAAVAETFVANFEIRDEVGASCAITLEGRTVLDMSFGYAMNRMGTGILLNERGQALVDAAYAALGYRSNASGAWAC